MNSTTLFTKPIPELDALPEKPKIFWYVSAGADFRGLVFLSQYHIDNFKQHQGKALEKPDLFVFSCLGSEVKQLKNTLSTGKAILFQDEYITISGAGYKELSLKEEFTQERLNPNHVDASKVALPQKGNEAFYFDVEIVGKKVNEVKKVLYFEYENIDFFNKVILQNFFEIVYLCNSDEGCAWGNCKKSIIEHIYSQGAPKFYTNRGFRPRFNILSKGSSIDFFINASTKTDVFSLKPNFLTYFSKKGEKPYELPNEEIFKIDYL